MKVHELSADDKLRLKQLYMKATMLEEPPTYGELCAADEIVDDEEIERVYGFVDLSEGFYLPERDEQYKHLIKINLSCSPDDMGAAEGIWAFVDDGAKEAYDTDESGGYHDCILDNDSFYWLGLYAGHKVKAQTRGKLRPVVPFEWLATRYDLNDEG